MPGTRKDPLRSHNFIVEIDGIARAGFREATGLDSAQAPIEYREGNDKNLTVQKLPGLVTYSAITLRWGMTSDADFWNWRKTAMDGKVERKNGSVVYLDETGQEVARWNFRDAWPSRWTGPGGNATGNEVAIEAVELTHEGIARA
jgi:phage tail-like protein